MECENDKIAGGVSQDTGTTAEELVKRRDGDFDDRTQATKEARAKVKDRAQTVNPFGGMKS